MAAAERGDWAEVERLEAAEKAAKPKSHPTKKPKSLSIKVQEIERYDGNPSMRFLLLILVLATRREKDNYSDTWAPNGWTAEEMVGWCDMAQWQLAERVGLTEGRIEKMLKQLEDHGFIRIEKWRDDDTGKLHCRYQVIEEMVDASQRKRSGDGRRAQRGSRYKEGSRKANKGSFSKTNQPTISAVRKAIMEEDDE
jgi:DNA-binding MarR family transcriptional regulator